MTRVVAADIGGTHARFAIAEVEGGKVRRLGHAVTLQTADHAGLQSAWETFGAGLDHPLPKLAGIAFAGPVGGEALHLTNSHWVVRPEQIPAQLHVDRHLILNDFAAVAHAAAQAGPEHFRLICGPDAPAPKTGVTSVLGPGTGLGVAYVARTGDDYAVHATEGGHGDFAPLDPFEDELVAALRRRHGRVSRERLVSGPGLRAIHDALAQREGRPDAVGDDAALWARALRGEDSGALAALDRFCMMFGAVAGDLALGQGADAVVVAGGLGRRLAGRLPTSGFAQRFAAKGRFEGLMAAIPVRLITLEEPGLFGAAAAIARMIDASPSSR